MSDNGFFLSILAIEMLLASQGNKKTVLPVESELKKAKTKDLYAEIYSMVSSGILLNEDGAESFEINQEFAPIIRSMISSEGILMVVKCSRPHTPVYYYLSKYGIVKLNTSSTREGVRLSRLIQEELTESVINNLGLPEVGPNLDSDKEKFINSVENHQCNPYRDVCSDMLSYSREKMIEIIDGIEGYVDLILNENLKTVKRIVVFKKNVYYKIAGITENTVNISNYSKGELFKVIEAITGVFYDYD